jgi:hypothetical protein
LSIIKEWEENKKDKYSSKEDNRRMILKEG